MGGLLCKCGPHSRSRFHDVYGHEVFQDCRVFHSGEPWVHVVTAYIHHENQTLTIVSSHHTDRPLQCRLPHPPATHWVDDQLWNPQTGAGSLFVLAESRSLLRVRFHGWDSDTAADCVCVADFSRLLRNCPGARIVNCVVDASSGSCVHATFTARIPHGSQSQSTT